MGDGGLARNAAAAAGRHVLTAALALAVTPYALGVLGPERFGLWALGGAVVAVVRLLDLGLERAVTREVADAHGRGAPGSAADDLATALGLMLGLGALAALGAWLARDLVVRLVFAVPDALRAEAVVVLVGSVVVAGLEGAFTPYRAALDGAGRMDVSSAIDAAQRAASALGTALALALGGGLAGLVAKNVLTALGAGAAYRARLGRHAPALAAADGRWRAARARRLVAFGRHVQTVSLGAVALDTGAKLILARGVGLGGVATWELAQRVVRQVGAALLAAVVAVFPAAAALRATPAGGVPDAGLRALYRTAAGAMALAVAAGFGLVVALAGPFVAAWLGPGQEAVARVMVGLALGWALAVLSTPAAMVAQAAGRARDVALASLATPAVGLAAAVLLAPRWGVAGVTAGVAAGLAAGALALAARFRGAFGLRARDLLPFDARLAAAVAAGLLVAAALGRLLPVGLGAVALAALAGAGAAAAAAGRPRRAAGRDLAARLAPRARRTAR